MRVQIPWGDGRTEDHLKKTSARGFQQVSWSGSIAAVEDFYKILTFAADAARASLEQEWALVEPVEGAAYKSRNAGEEWGDQGWANHCEYQQEEIDKAGTVSCKVTDLRGQDSVEGDFSAVIGHFAANNIGEIKFSMHAEPQEVSEHQFDLTLGRHLGAIFSIASSRPEWTSHYEREIRDALAKQTIRNDWLVRGLWTAAMVALPVVAAAAYTMFSFDLSTPALVGIAAAALGWALIVSPVIASRIGEKVPHFETYAVGDQAPRARFTAAISSAISLVLTIGLGVLGIFG